jgi:hypothetical protein
VSVSGGCAALRVRVQHSVDFDETEPIAMSAHPTLCCEAG